MIAVLAGVNGAGKSSIAGAKLEREGGAYFNPDVESRRIRERRPDLSEQEANSIAWYLGRDLLESAIENDDDYAFETTLGGQSITQLLIEAAQKNRKIGVFYCGLASAELHLARVADRVARGGHDIPEDKIRARWKDSIINMLTLLPLCYKVAVWDNSEPADSHGPRPVKLFSMTRGQFDPNSRPDRDMPEWAKPLASEALKIALGNTSE